MQRPEISVTLDPPSADDFIRFRADCGWGELDETVAAKSLAAGLVNVSCFAGDTLVGFGRAVGDGVLYFYLQDIIVHPDWRGKSIGKTIVNALMDEIRKVAPKGATVGLMAADGKEAFYEQFGFKSRPAEGYGAGMTLFL
ncbi:MAG: GNAT family N-acetyltransferase [Alphaproteobacteria bacterium]|nr:GNAT family N-acetyltransferase [Alphaproteobacteria bacterium]